ncbi:(2Fe-2S)-binding protein [Aeribacillus sp. FSL K6-2833]|uniref:(2Fe-2S)-binding protein n=1 Tax=Aeribacillus sp. FSL K6-2833 TaxID=2954611 RepID=UPI0030DAB5DF
MADKQMSSSIKLPSEERMRMSIFVNGKKKELEIHPAARLVDILREQLHLTGTKISCGIGRCGACSVIMNGRLVNACLVRAYQANEKEIVTIEGLAEKGLHPIQQAFLEEGGFQCGYCTPGMIMAVKAILDQYPNPTSQQIVDGLSGNLCRCTGYSGIIRAVQKLDEKETSRLDSKC